MTLVDTNVISEMLKREPNAGVVSFFELEDTPALSVVTIEEMAYGVAWRPGAKLQSAFDRIVSHWPHILPITPDIAARWGCVFNCNDAATLEQQLTCSSPPPHWRTAFRWRPATSPTLKAAASRC